MIKVKITLSPKGLIRTTLIAKDEQEEAEGLKFLSLIFDDINDFEERIKDRAEIEGIRCEA